MRCEHALVRHQRHGRARPKPSHARDVPRRQRLLDEAHTKVRQHGQAACRDRLVPGLIGIDDEAGAPLQSAGKPAQAGEVDLRRLRADLDFERIVQTGGELPFRLFDLLPGIARGERPQHRHAIADGAAEQRACRNTEGLAHGVEKGGFNRRLRGVVALGGSVHARARCLEAIGAHADQRRSEIGVDRCLDALDAFLAPARAAQRRGLADAVRAIGQAQLDDDVALRRDGEG